MRRITIAATGVLLATALLAATGCTRVRLQDTPGTQPTIRSESLPLGGATKLDSELRVAVGDLKVSADSSPTTQAMTARFEYAPASWKPEVDYSVAGGVGQLTVEQPSNVESPAFHDTTNKWDVRLALSIPTSVRLRLGVGTSDVDLSAVDVTDLDAVTGVGSTTIDLTGPRTHDVNARIESGVGELTIRVPKDVGVRVRGRQNGVGDFNADGFIAQGDTWVNAAYAGSGPKIEIDLVRGVGSVTLVAAS